MKILSLNTWQERGPWRKRWDLILKGLKEYDADIVGLQEVFNMEWAEEVRKRSGYPYLAVSGKHSGLIFLSRFKPVEQECILLTKSPNEDYNRYAFYVRVNPGSGEIALFNTHLSWQVEDSAAREKQVSELAAFIKRKAHELPTAVMGDFNTAPDTAPILFVRDTENWTDTFAAANHNASGLTWNYKNPYAALERDKMAERRIDYIFVPRLKPPFGKISSSKVVFDEPAGDIWPSDHFGVVTEFSDKL